MTIYPVLDCMEIESIPHKALRAFAESGKARGLPGNLVARLRNTLVWLSVIETVDELLAPPNFGAHRLGGDREGTWSLTVTRNWRMTFRINAANAVEDLNLEDYH